MRYNEIYKDIQLYTGIYRFIQVICAHKTYYKYIYDNEIH